MERMEFNIPLFFKIPNTPVDIDTVATFPKSFSPMLNHLYIDVLF